MSGAEWSIPLGFLIYLAAIIIAIIYYLRFKKWSLVMYIASIATYAFSLFYAWDVFELSKNWVLMLLVFSAILMFAVAHYFKGISLDRAKPHTSLKERHEKKAK